MTVLILNRGPPPKRILFEFMGKGQRSSTGVITRNLLIGGKIFMEEDKKLEQVKGVFKYDKDTFRFHRFNIVAEEEGINGTIYVSKEFKKMPKRIVLENARANS